MTGGRISTAGVSDGCLGPIAELSVEEVWSSRLGVDGHRRRLGRLLADPTTSTLVVERRLPGPVRGRASGQAALAAHGRKVFVVDDGELADDLVADMTEVLTSFCAQLHGARNRADKVLRCARADIGRQASAGIREPRC
jgi:putative resolvase